MGRKKREKSKKRKEEKKAAKERAAAEAAAPVEEESFLENKTKAKAADYLVALARSNQKQLLKEYELVSRKHNDVLKIPNDYKSCRDLKTDTMTRFQILKLGFSFRTVLDQQKEREKEKEKEIKTGARKKRKSPKNVLLKQYEEMFKVRQEELGTDETSPTKLFTQVDKTLFKYLYINNLRWFVNNIHFELVGFNPSRFLQIPFAYPDKPILENTCAYKAVQEALISLRITEPHMVQEGLQEETVRILAFGLTQDRLSLRIYFSIPNIFLHDTNKIELRLTNTSVSFYADNFNEKFFVFQLKNLAHKVNPGASFYKIEGRDFVVIHVMKKKLGLWKNLFTVSIHKKLLWEEEMKVVLDSSSEPEYCLEVLPLVWRLSLIIVNGETNLLNLYPDLNPVKRKFENIEDMIIFYKQMIRIKTYQKSLLYILGAAVWSKLLRERNRNLLKKRPVKVEHEVDLEAEVIFMKEEAIKVAAEAHFKYVEGKHEEALELYVKSLDYLDMPFTHIEKARCLFGMKRYKEAFIDSLISLRHLSIFEAYEAVITILKYRMITGKFISSVDLAISLQYCRPDMERDSLLEIQNIRKKGMKIIKILFIVQRLILRREFKASLSYLEYVEEHVRIKGSTINIMLVLLYYMLEEYNKASRLGKLILKENTIYSNLAYYLIGMSDYYLNYLNSAVFYLEKVNATERRDIIKVQIINRLLEDCEKFMRQGKERDAIRQYTKVLEIEEDNEKLILDVWTKLGKAHLMVEDYECAIHCFTSCLSLTKNSQFYLLRGAAYTKMGRIVEAEIDFTLATEV